VGTSETLFTTVEAPLEPAPRLDPHAFNVVLLGPSGAGKSTVAECLDKLGIADVNPTLATRPLRQTESGATIDHTFVSQEHFAAAEQAGQFVVAKNYYGFDYGAAYLRQPPDGQVPLTVLKTNFMAEFLAYYPNTRIYQIEVSPAVAYERMFLRGHQSDTDLQDRMKHYGGEVDAGRLIAHTLFDNDRELASTVQRVAAQICIDSTL
jgi:ribose 1,5-bisphosphokinase PhnN